MPDTEIRAERKVCGFDLYLRRPHAGARWEVALCDRSWPEGNPFTTGMFLSIQTIRGEHFRGRTFAMPDDAADYVRQLLGR